MWMLRLVQSSCRSDPACPAQSLLYNDAVSSELDKVFKVVSRELPEAGVDCLMIGGHAVNHYGFTRATKDVDFMIASSDEDAVRRAMKNGGFTSFSSYDNAAFFHCPESPLRVDFLKVDRDTMDKLMAEAESVDYCEGLSVNVPRLEHLIAMKLFALKGGNPNRFDKDFPDIVHLVLEHKIDLESSLRPLCDRFGTPELYDKLRVRIEELSGD